MPSTRSRPLSIAPPSDIVLDVAQAADPLKVQAATARLASLAGKSAGIADDFSTVLAQQSKTTTTAPAQTSPLVQDYGVHRTTTKAGSPYQKFEALVLQNFVETMLPKDNDLFGDKFSADAYRSMMADKLAGQMAATGRLGIAQAIERKHGPTAPPGLALMQPVPTGALNTTVLATDTGTQPISKSKV